ncbi:fatty acyl-CoA reductase wat-like [Ceratina calcarata]|uniref:Fatty acyl-CoA reductase n=1 Tax=Ceratina calcarata TaxID=156304 RepID=A0AAJ7RZL7_9HYME|nr:fatty acyl-CoA reductase wat-like [Ceratina calcarata]
MNVTSDSKKSDGQIRNFYARKHVFLTGCTGFDGSLILEKLLRTCTDIGNVYIMTREKKAVAEGVVEDFAKQSSLPCIIYRPSIIIIAIREPYRGWIDTKYGPVVLLALQAFGLLHVVPAEPGVISDYIPVDLATNGLLSAIWDYTVNRETNEPQEYNCGSSDWNPMRFHTDCPKYTKSIEKYPSSKIVWYPFMFLVGNIYVFLVLHVLFHVLPAIIADVVLMIQSKKPKALKVVSKATVQVRALYYFISTSWIITADKLKSVMNRMDVTDLEEFSFDMTLIDWVEVSEVLALNARKIVKGPIEAIPDASRRFQKLEVLDYTIVTLLWTLAFFFLFRIIS